MPRAFEKPDQHENYVQSSWTVGMTAVCWISLIVFVALMANSPTASTWVSEAAQAEFAGSMMPGQAPLQTAEPAREFHTIKEFHTVRAN
jgi:hypothetical protein